MFVQGRGYRRRWIHAEYGGQRQGGISTPSGHPIVLLFTGTSGEQYGYLDSWTRQGIFEYTGEGQRGDMKMIRGNAAILNHVSQSEDLHLFEATDDGLVRYFGQMECVGFKTHDATDRDDRKRKAIIFSLVPIGPLTLAALEMLAEREIRRRGLKTPHRRMRGLRTVNTLIRQILPDVEGDASRLTKWPQSRLVPRLEKAKGQRLNGAESSALSILLAQLPAEPGERWRDAVLRALRRVAERDQTRKIRRQVLLDKERQRIVQETKTEGSTPDQTVSRVLQELRDEGVLYFLGRGTYLLLDTPLDVEAEDLPDSALDFAVGRNKVRLGAVPTSDEKALGRRRKGQDRVRALTLRNYGGRCAFCDVTDEKLLVAGHISRWADDIEGRGNLTNVICMCRFHDALFEAGYLSLSDDLMVARKGDGGSTSVASNLGAAREFRSPTEHPPAPEFLRKHRKRTGHKVRI